MHAVTRISGSAPRGPAAQTSTGAALKLPYSPGWSPSRTLTSGPSSAARGTSTTSCPN